MPLARPQAFCCGLLAVPRLSGEGRGRPKQEDAEGQVSSALRRLEGRDGGPSRARQEVVRRRPAPPGRHAAPRELQVPLPVGGSGPLLACVQEAARPSSVSNRLSSTCCWDVHRTPPATARDKHTLIIQWPFQAGAARRGQHTKSFLRAQAHRGPRAPHPLLEVG